MRTLILAMAATTALVSSAHATHRGGGTIIGIRGAEASSFLEVEIVSVGEAGGEVSRLGEVGALVNGITILNGTVTQMAFATFVEGDDEEDELNVAEGDFFSEVVDVERAGQGEENDFNQFTADQGTFADGLFEPGPPATFQQIAEGNADDPQIGTSGEASITTLLSFDVEALEGAIFELVFGVDVNLAAFVGEATEDDLGTSSAEVGAFGTVSNGAGPGSEARFGTAQVIAELGPIGACDLNRTIEGSATEDSDYACTGQSIFRYTFAEAGFYTLDFTFKTAIEVDSPFQEAVAVPAPAALALFGLGVLGLARLRRR